MRLSVIFFACFHGVPIGCSLGSAGADARKPNVLFLICDDLNCDLACYDHPVPGEFLIHAFRKVRGEILIGFEWRT